MASVGLAAPAGGGPCGRIPSLRAAVAATPDDPAPRVELAALLRDAHLPEAARCAMAVPPAACLDAIPRPSARSHVGREASVLLIGRGRTTAARGLLAAVLDIDPGEPVATSTHDALRSPLGPGFAAPRAGERPEEVVARLIAAFAGLPRRARTGWGGHAHRRHQPTGPRVARRRAAGGRA